MRRFGKHFATVAGVITTVFLFYTLAMVVFGICALCGAFSGVAEGSLWHTIIIVFVLGYLAVVALAGVCVLSRLVTLFIRTLRDKEKGWPLLLKWGRWFAVGALIGLAAVFVRYGIKGSFSASDPTFPLYTGILSFEFFRWKNHKSNKNKGAGAP